MDISHSVFYHWCKFQSSLFGYCGQCCLGYSCICFCEHTFFIRSGNAGSYGNSVINILRNYKTFLKWLQQFTFPPMRCEGLNFFKSWPILVFVCVCRCPGACQGILWLVALIWICLKVNDFEYLFMCLCVCLLAMCISFLEKCFLKSFAHFNCILLIVEL